MDEAQRGLVNCLRPYPSMWWKWNLNWGWFACLLPHGVRCGCDVLYFEGGLLGRDTLRTLSTNFLFS